ncbi:MAG: PLP-dependent aminotransferase family protein [Sedimenticola sp.]|nr:PLP-dependent aminotransferase family protein [Sedimenticola sp.]
MALLKDPNMYYYMGPKECRLMLLELDGDGPLYLQIYRAMKLQILAGHLSEGAKLPASRILANQLSVSRNVVMLGYDQLKAEGYVIGHKGGGTRVVDCLPDERLDTVDQARNNARKESAAPKLSAQATISLAYWQGRARLSPQGNTPLTYDFRYGDIEVDQQSKKQWRRLTARLFNNDVHQYGSPQGETYLREKIAEYVNRNRGCQCSPEQIAIVNGSQQALDIIARLFISPGDKVIVEEPGYLAAKAVFQAAGASVIPMAVDQDGMQVESLSQQRSKARLLYVTPSHQFPTGSILSLSRRLALLEWAEKAEGFIIEDDYDSEFRFEGRPIAALQGLDKSSRTLYIGTFSKVLFPALRIGYVILPPDLVEPFIALRWHSDRHTGTHQQRVLAEFIAAGFYERHLRRMRKRYESRRRLLIASLQASLGSQIELHGTNAGLHLMVVFKDRSLLAKETEILSTAWSAGLGIYPASPLYQLPPERLGLLFGYSGIEDAAIQPGIALLKQVIEPFLS